MTNYLNLSVCLLNGYELGKWESEEEFREFVVGYKALLQEVADKRMTLWDMVRWAEEKTKVDIRSIVTEVYGDFEIVEG